PAARTADKAGSTSSPVGFTKPCMLDSHPLKVPAGFYQTFHTKIIGMVVRAGNNVYAHFLEPFGGLWFGAKSAWGGTPECTPVNDLGFQIARDHINAVQQLDHLRKAGGGHHMIKRVGNDDV